MTEKKQGHSQEGLTLLNAFSIQEITTIFGDIDDKILSLHTCSSEDFLTLNAYFKKYYSDSKNISENAKILFDLITHAENKAILFKQINEFQNCLLDLLQQYENYQIKITNSFDLMIQEMEQMFVTANNLKQDLMTLKFLVTNLKLDITIFSHSDKMTQKANDFNELIIQTKSFFIEFFKNSNDFKTLLKTTNAQLTQYRDKIVLNFNELVNEIKHSSNLLDEKYDEASQLVPKLSESTQSTSSSIAKIITNLQYQDIIRQKIDHIQHTHKEILNELKEIKDSDNEQTKLDIRIKCFIQIRDIAGLQASQLIHTNKEYQKAVEIITTKFLEVGQEMTQISDLCNSITGGGSSNKYSHFDVIREKFEKSSYITEQLQKAFQLSQEKTNSAEEQFEIIYNNYLELSDFIKTIHRSISKSANYQLTLNSENTESTANQIKSTLNEINSINILYQSQFEKINHLKNDISQNDTKQKFLVDKLEKTIFAFSNNYLEITQSLNIANDKIYKILAENQILSARISADIKTSIEQIKYYDFFDKVIEEIIGKLNDINQKLQNIEGMPDTDKNIDYLKERYTMESEHIIHDNIFQNKQLNLEDLESTTADEEDDNLELF